MSEFDSKPLVLFKTLTNTELGAERVRIDADGDVVLVDVLKKVTESMLTSYPRTQLGLWTPEPRRAPVQEERDRGPRRAPLRHGQAAVLRRDQVARELIASRPFLG